MIDRAKFAPAAALGGGAYVLSDSDSPVGVIVATGSEVHTALAAQDLLAGEGVATRVVAMPSWELFEARSVEERETVLPANLPTVSVEAGVSMGWDRWANAHVAIDHFGASAPGDELLERFGITAEAVAEKLRGLLAS